MKRIVIFPDWQVPLHDEHVIKTVARFVWDYQPDALGHVGDATDSTEIGRWTRGLRGEFTGGLEGGFAKTRELFSYIRRGFDGPFHLMRSNHEDRLENAIESRLPGLAGITVGGKLLNIQNALQLDDLGITWHEQPYEIAPGVMLQHGDEGGLSQIPGNTALQLAVGVKGQRKSVVCGHTHRAGLAYLNGMGDDSIFGMEVGHMMDIRGAEYLGKARANNWGTAFGILRVHEGNKKKVRVYPELVPVELDGSFVVEGQRYGGGK
ncbi:hypothetical protein [Lentzea sp. NBRC 102530]|uniref:hypothetical protein n=1 Tax=Lentzea sp. NBRC 102530 TaxID=3032201 RepID=UPI0024A3AC31|nr:hypothetical protein [Lentzea sp. NBRC 102530]GLY55366.1 hypothetical protein Lesp01_90210 [Lentzea sp. NBRC 102530]